MLVFKGKRRTKRNVLNQLVFLYEACETGYDVGKYTVIPTATFSLQATLSNSKFSQST